MSNGNYLPDYTASFSRTIVLILTARDPQTSYTVIIFPNVYVSVKLCSHVKERIYTEGV
jgi:hypothetical protein